MGLVDEAGFGKGNEEGVKEFFLTLTE